MPLKKQSYKEAFLNFGFTSVIENSIEKLQCVICFKVLTQESMKPSKLKQYFKSCHGKLVKKLYDYFRRKAENLKNRHLDSGGIWPRQNKALLEVSYHIAFRITQSKKPHTIGNELIKPCLYILIKQLLWYWERKKRNKLEEISLSNYTVKKCFFEMSQDILLQVVKKIRSCPIIFLQLDESTDVSSCAHLLVYTRYIFENNIKEQYLFSEPLSTTCKEKDVFRVVEVFFESHTFDWKQVVVICTDGAPSMIGDKSGFKGLVTNVAPLVSFTHCLIHCFALAMKTFRSGLQEILQDVAKITNHISANATRSRLFTAFCEEVGSDYKVLLLHTEVRWLSRDKVLNCLLQLQEEAAIFLKKNKMQKELICTTN